MSHVQVCWQQQGVSDCAPVDLVDNDRERRLPAQSRTCWR